jgi:hypothetical protein
MNLVWKIVWKMKAHSKVKIFTWRALHGIIPLKCILANRHIGDTGGCPICNQGPEDVSHLLFTCPAARDLWTALDIIDIIDDAVQTDCSGSGVLEILLRRENNAFPGFTDSGLKEVLVIGCWYLWWLRGSEHMVRFLLFSLAKCRFCQWRPTLHMLQNQQLPWRQSGRSLILDM